MFLSSPFASRRAKIALFATILSLCLCFWQGLSNSSSGMDVRGYLAMGATWMHGANPYAVSEPAVLARFGVPPEHAFPAVLPHALPILGALSALPLSAALRVIWTLSFVGFVASALQLVRHFGREWTPVEACLFVGILAQSRLIQSVAYRGQWGLILLVPLLMAVWCEERQRPVAAGVYLALALIKPTFALPVIALFLIRRAWLALTSAAAMTIAAGLVASIPAGARAVLRSYPVAVHQFVVLDRPLWAGSWHLTSWQAIAYEAFGTATPISEACGAGFLAAAGGAVLFIAWRQRTRHDDGWAFAALLLLGQIGTYHRVYDGVPTFAVAALLWTRVRRRPIGSLRVSEWLATILTVLLLFVFSAQAISKRVGAMLSVIPTASAVNAWVSILLFASVVAIWSQDRPPPAEAQQT